MRPSLTVVLRERAQLDVNDRDAQKHSQQRHTHENDGGGSGGGGGVGIANEVEALNPKHVDNDGDGGVYHGGVDHTRRFLKNADVQEWMSIQVGS
jgi:hypothetical protein